MMPPIMYVLYVRVKPPPPPPDRGAPPLLCIPSGMTIDVYPW